MAADRGFSAQTLAVLAALAAEPTAWRHGYDLARQTALKSGTLYPILVRLADRGLLDACWEDIQPAGRPRRHLYRLSSEGLAQAEAELARPTATTSRATTPCATTPSATTPRATTPSATTPRATT